MIRRLKKDILQQLPKKKRSIVKIKVDSTEKAAELADLLVRIRKQELEIVRRKELKKMGNSKCGCFITFIPII